MIWHISYGASTLCERYDEKAHSNGIVWRNVSPGKTLRILLKGDRCALQALQGKTTR